MSKHTASQTNITTEISDQGLSDQPWWVEQWMELINSYRFKKRLERAWTYAREGNVLSIKFEGRRVNARVQGTEEEPYKVKLWLDVLSDEDWCFVMEALTQKARWSAQLLAGIMPTDIERAFAASGRRLFPFNLQEVKSECSCPDKANPCKHISAIYFLMGDHFREDPFVLFQLRGRSRKILLADLALQRSSVLNKNGKDSVESIDSSKATTQFEELPIAPHPAVIDPSLWWKYNSNLNSDLVVITPTIEGDTALDEAGDVPFADDPKFPDSRKTFLKHLQEQGKIFAQKAMIQAMSADEYT